MKKRRRSIEGEFCLPEAMIQHIQSFLPVKAAARTTTVSQSWHTAWSTRPNLEFDLRDFTPNNTDAFWEFMDKTLQRFVERDVDFQGVRKIAVENLNIGGMHCVDSHIVKCLFQSCRPKFITQYSYPSIGRNMFLKILYKTLMQGARRVRSSVFVAQDLEEVNVELFEESDEEWRPLPWSTLFKNSSQLKKKKKLRLQLKWRPELSDPGDADMR